MVRAWPDGSPADALIRARAVVASKRKRVGASDVCAGWSNPVAAPALCSIVEVKAVEVWAAVRATADDVEFASSAAFRDQMAPPIVVGAPEAGERCGR